MPFNPFQSFGSLSDSDLREYDDTGVVIDSFEATPVVEIVEKRGHVAEDADATLTGVACANAGDLLSKSTHGLQTGQLVEAADFSTGLGDGRYYVIYVSAGTLQLAETLAEAYAGVALAISADGTGGTLTPINPASYRQIVQVQSHMIALDLKASGEVVPNTAGQNVGLAKIGPGEHIPTLANFTTNDEIARFRYDSTKLLLAKQATQSRSPETPTKINIETRFYPKVAKTANA